MLRLLWQAVIVPVMMMHLALGVFLATVISVPLLASYLTKKGVLDRPIDRSSHFVPTPRGAGIVIMPIILGTWFWLSHDTYAWPDHTTFLSVIACCAFLCFVTWWDDYKPEGLRVRTRLGVQLLAVSIPLIVWPADAGKILPDTVPVVTERILMAIAWLWFSNLYNFMDGINGITAAETISIAGGLLVFCFFSKASLPTGYEEIVMVPLAAAAGFMVWNGRKVAKIFLGDVGSIGFGYCLAFLLFVFAARNYMMPAVLISLVYSVDATLTLIKRAWQRKKIWRAHREHYYHRVTVPGGMPHMACVAIIVWVNIILMMIGMALLHSIIKPMTGFMLGMTLVLLLMAYFYVYGYRVGHKSSPRPKAFWIERLMRVGIKQWRRK